MFRYAIFGLAGAAVVLACAGVAIKPTPSATPAPATTATPAPTASPPLSPTPTSTPTADKAGRLEPGVYVAHPFAPDESMSFTFTVPSNSWEGYADPGQMIGIALYGANEGVAMGFLHVFSLNGDPCNWAESADDVAIGPSVDDLVNALVESPDYDTSPPTDKTLGGYSGRYVQVTMPAPLPSAGCDEGQYRIWNADGFNIYAQGPSSRWSLAILDVEGERVLVLASDYANTPTARQSELQSIVDSTQITP